MCIRDRAPTDPVALLRAGFDYWALGHIHKRWVNDERAPRIAFSGCIQGRDVRETGPRGVNLVTLAVDAPPKVSFIPTASVVWEKVRIDVSDCTNIPALVSKTMRELFAVNGDASCEMMVSRIILTGATSLHEVLGRPGVLEEVRASLNDAYSEFYCDSPVAYTHLPSAASSAVDRKMRGIVPVFVVVCALLVITLVGGQALMSMREQQKSLLDLSLIHI